MNYTTLDLLKKVFPNPLMLMIAVIELTSGVLRNGIMQWYTIFAHEVKQPGAEFILDQLGLAALHLRHRRRVCRRVDLRQVLPVPPRAARAVLFCAFMFMMAAVMAMYLFSLPFVVGVAALLIVAAVIGVHSLMSGHGGGRFRRTQSDRHLFGHRRWLRLSRQRRAVDQRRLPGDSPQLAVVADLPDALRAHRRIDCLAHLARTAGRYPPLYRQCRAPNHAGARNRGAGCSKALIYRSDLKCRLGRAPNTHGKQKPAENFFSASVCLA